MLVEDWQDSQGIADFLGQQLLEFVFRFFIESFINSLLAFVWPLLLIGQLELWGVGLLVVGYFAFERAIKPRLAKFIPDDNPDAL